MKKCRLCDVDAHQELWNEPLLESQNFVVLPSLGALVEGWLLVVPKDHYPCLGALPKELDEEFDSLKLDVKAMLQTIYGRSAVVFEHGPYREQCDVGCGVDHAHLHVVPSPVRDVDLAELALPYLPEGITWSWATKDDCVLAFSQRREYLCVESVEGSLQIAVGQGFTGQIFRRVIASLVQKDHEYNWREFLQLETVKQTISRIEYWKKEQTAEWCPPRRKLAA